MAKVFDVAIVGGGMVGAALACALGRGGLRVAMIEGRAPATFGHGGDYDLRVSAITLASQRIFASLGAWSGMSARRVSPFTDMHVWDAAGPGVIHFNAADIGVPQLGHIIENRVIQSALWDVLRGIANVEVYCPAAAAAFETNADEAALTLQDGRRLRAQLVVGADGADSRIRVFAGIATRGWAYDQQAVVATVTTELPHRATAWQRFMPTGPLAFLPLGDGRSSIVWSATAPLADELLALDDAAFCARLTKSVDGRLGTILAASARASFPLRLQHAGEYVRARLALVGDAAHTVHPLAGQGVNLGLLDAASLAEVLLMAQADGRPLGAFATLRRYERWRKGDNLLMMGVMDGFKRLFGNELVPLAWLRNLGMSLADRSGPLKTQLMRHAVGLDGDLPALARASPVNGVHI